MDKITCRRKNERGRGVGIMKEAPVLEAEKGSTGEGGRGNY